MSGLDNQFKVLLIGNSGVGKTCTILRYCGHDFSESCAATVGIDFQTKDIVKDGKDLTVQIWDTAGQERYRSITTAYYRGSNGFIMMYDITNKESLAAIRSWANDIKTHVQGDTKVVMVGNKSDIEDKRVVTFEQGKKVADELEFPFFEISAQDDKNIVETFDKLLELMIEQAEPEPVPSMPPPKPERKPNPPKPTKPDTNATNPNTKNTNPATNPKSGHQCNVNLTKSDISRSKCPC